jgi:hypothetical protein
MKYIGQYILKVPITDSHLISDWRSYKPLMVIKCQRCFNETSRDISNFGSKLIQLIGYNVVSACEVSQGRTSPGKAL